MAAIDWKSVQGPRMPSVNPNTALATASNAFAGINKTIAANEEAESLAAYRGQQIEMANRKQTFVEGAGDRAILAEQQKFDLTKQRSIDQNNKIFDTRDQLVEQKRQDFNFSEDTIANLQSNKLFQQLPELAQKQMMADSLHQIKSNDAAFLDRNQFSGDFKESLLLEGMSQEVANSSSENFNNRVFPTGSKDIAQMQLDAMGNPISEAAELKLFSGGNGSNGSNGYFDVGNAIKSNEFVSEFYKSKNMNESRSSAAGLLGSDTDIFDAKSNNLYEDKIKGFVGQMAAEGINEVSAIKALDALGIRDGVLTDDYRGINSGGLSEPVFNDVLAKAQQFQGLGQRGGSTASQQSGILGALNSSRNNRTDTINNIMGTLSNNGLGQKGRSEFLSSDSTVRSFAKKYGYTLPEATKKTEPEKPKPKPVPDKGKANKSTKKIFEENTSSTPAITPKPSPHVDKVKKQQKENKLPSQTPIQKTARIFEQSSVPEKKKILSNLGIKDRKNLMDNVDTSIAYRNAMKQSVQDAANGMQSINDAILGDIRNLGTAAAQDKERLGNLGSKIGTGLHNIFGDTPEQLRAKRKKKAANSAEEDLRFNELLRPTLK